MQTSPQTAKELPDSIVWKSLEHLLQKFQLNEHEGTVLMGDMPRSSYYKGIKTHQGKLGRDAKERVSLLLGIYKALRILFIDPEQAMSWINRENSLSPFNGMTPKQYMMEGSLVRLSEVRKFLDYWRGY